MKKIPLTQGKFALVDDTDFDRVSGHKWCAVEKWGNFYAERSVIVNKKSRVQGMHRFILSPPSHLMVDHKDGNGLNNQRGNIRPCTNAQNGMNRKLNSGSRSGYKGVCWSKRRNKWLVTVNHQRRSIYVGLFFCLIKAAKAYDKVAIETFGDFARPNFPQATLKRK